jgi:RHS repeat-associated protein
MTAVRTDDQRYYSSIMGRFLTPDPTLGNVAFSDPQSWNSYAYANGDPVNSNDPSGLQAQTCGEISIVDGVFKGQTVSQVMTGTSGNDLLAQIIWHEGGTIYASDLTSPASIQAYHKDLAAIGTAVLNQWDVDNHRLKVYRNGKLTCPLGHCLDRSLQEIIIKIGTYKNASGNLVNIFDSSGHMVDGAAKLKGILDTDASAGPVVYDNGIAVNQGCEGIVSSLVHASNLLSGSEARVSPNGTTLLFWNQLPADSTKFYRGYSGWRDDRVQGETFWGLPSAPQPREPRQ